MQYGRIIALMSAILIASPAHAQSKQSDNRPGVRVEKLYRQQIDSTYFTDWYARLEKKSGVWRDVYFETNDKFVNKGVISFNCASPRADIGVVKYDTGRYGDASARRVVRVRFADRRSWAEDQYEPLQGEDPPFALYQVMARKYCR